MGRHPYAWRLRSGVSSDQAAEAEYSYVRTVLERGGFMQPSSRGGRALFKGGGGHYSVASLADPIVLLGIDVACSMSTATELLPHPRGAARLTRVWNRVWGFAAVDCRVVGDIDALMATDLKMELKNTIELNYYIILIIL